MIEGKDTEVYECKVATNIAKEKGIPLDDPVFHPFSLEVIERHFASISANEMQRKILYGQLAATLANAKGDLNLKYLAKILGVSNPQELFASIILAYKEKNKDPESYSARINHM